MKLFSSRSRRQPPKRRWRRLIPVLYVMFAAVLVVSTVVAVTLYRQGREEEDAFVSLAAYVEQAAQESALASGTQTVQAASDTAEADEAGESAAETETAPTDDVAASEAEADAEVNTETVTETDAAGETVTAYAVLSQLNADFCAWLTVPGTGIDYPVMYTPEDPEYYIRRDFYGESSRGGTPFIGEGGSLDSDCFIIYGHNLLNDNMFGTLDNYADASFWQENPTFTLTTATETRTYEIFAAVRTRVLYTDEAGLRYYNYSGSLTESDFTNLTTWLTGNALYSTGVTPEYGEQLLILSTCDYQLTAGRFIVAARRVS